MDTTIKVLLKEAEEKYGIRVYADPNGFKCFERSGFRDIIAYSDGICAFKEVEVFESFVVCELVQKEPRPEERIARVYLSKSREWLLGFDSPLPNFSGIISSSKNFLHMACKNKFSPVYDIQNNKWVV